MTNPLTGIRVLDLTRLLPGAVCTLMLADLGADVIKVEDPNGGDYARWMPPLVEDLSIFFHMNNRDKRSLILDLKHPEGPAVLHHLVAQADVLVEGFRPDVMKRLGCGYDTLRSLNPRLIYCAISGWGADGPYAERSGHDLNYVSVAGLTGAMETPQVIGGQIGDMSGAYLAFSGIMAALFRRERTGEGAFVDVSLFESSLPFALYAWAEAVATGAGGGQGSLTGALACYRVYRTRDHQHISLAALEPKFWANFCAAVQRPDLLPDHVQPERQPVLRAELEALFASRTAAEWDALLLTADCCYARVNPPAAVSDDPHIRARQSLGTSPTGIPWIRTPLRFSDTPSFTPGAAPAYGQHTRAVLREFGYPDSQIDSLIAAQIVRD